MKNFQATVHIPWQSIGIVILIALPLHGSNGDLTSQDMVHAIQYRYYLIRRLEKTIAVLANTQPHKKPSFTRSGMAERFVHPSTRSALHAMEVRRSVVPFYKVWGDFLSYRFIHNKDFVREVLTTLLLLYRERIIDIVGDQEKREELTRSVDSHIEHLLTQEVHTACEATLALVNQSAELCYRATHDMEKLQELNELLTGQHTVASIHQGPGDLQGGLGTITNLLGEPSVDDVVVINNMRFYHIQRMLKSMFILVRRGVTTPLDIASYDLAHTFKCSTIQTCSAEIQQTHSIEPLLRVWSQFASYDFIKDEQLLQEFIQLTVLVYHHNIKSLIDIHGETATSKWLKANPKDLLVMYEKISVLPIADLLELLDDVVEQYDALANHYELRNSELTWDEWFKRYWWALPIIAGSMVFTLLKHTSLLSFLR